ncbi:hypothetical protein [Ureibacillus aquaedulcis]|uniref:Uncharacterized protein n=1 Tax=Ureibacillus aquaedulcis TaxID=3058421 RepID=A0ABT8GMG7_9BACL|nr:hypothetical protein [Ureibacillus sp. BA0131]MDN4492622.1 hypothetical protein [Ureibacillus sp. BA0131]
MKKIAGILIAVILCGVIWYVITAKEHAQQMEGKISRHYLNANYLLNDIVEELLAWNFSQPLSAEDEGYLIKLSDQLHYTSDLMFSGDVVHQDWRNQMTDTQDYLSGYVYDQSLSDEDRADLHQALWATHFILMDFRTAANNKVEYYDAMNNEKNEMVEKVNNRLATQF